MRRVGGRACWSAACCGVQGSQPRQAAVPAGGSTALPRRCPLGSPVPPALRRSPPPAALTTYFNGTDLGPLDKYFGADQGAWLARCTNPEPIPFAWDLSGVRPPACALPPAGRPVPAALAPPSLATLQPTQSTAELRALAADVYGCPTIISLARYYRSSEEVINATGGLPSRLPHLCPVGTPRCPGGGCSPPPHPRPPPTPPYHAT